MKRPNPIIVLMIILSILIIIMLVIYFTTFNCGLSQNNTDWGSFGSYIGSVTGLLAFIGILYTIEQNHRQYKDDSERNIFFSLLDLHRNKMNQVTINNTVGPEAFKILTEHVNSIFTILILNKITLESLPDVIDNNYCDEIKKNKKLYSIIAFTYNFYFNDKDLSIITDNKVIIKNLSNLHHTLKTNNNLFSKDYINKFLNEKSKLDINYIYSIIKVLGNNKLLSYIKESADYIYREYGYITGHYFRNMYYAMDTIRNFSDIKYYKKMFRAQLSRYELALGLYNAISSISSVMMIEILQSFDIFKDVYKDDIIFIKALDLCSEDQNKKIKELLSENKEMREEDARLE